MSNSRVTSHTVPRWSSLFVSPSVDPTAVSEVITAVDESHRCRERLTVSAWTEGTARARFQPGLAEEQRQ